MDETWVHHFQLETKQQSNQWKHLRFPPPKEANTEMSAGKVMASILWDAIGVLLVDYQDKDHTITGAYYCRSSEPATGKNQADSAWKGDNMSALPSTRTILRHTRPQWPWLLLKCGFQFVEDPPYSPDLAPSDNSLSPKMKKKELCGHNFTRYDDDMNVK